MIQYGIDMGKIREIYWKLLAKRRIIREYSGKCKRIFKESSVNWLQFVLLGNEPFKK